MCVYELGNSGAGIDWESPEGCEEVEKEREGSSVVGPGPRANLAEGRNGVWCKLK